ncbi:MAG: hypothetical protein GY847_26865 [Proteobacteria bacterium]|nr:hypothetical protein [Pseudomonadota bacterium]
MSDLRSLMEDRRTIRNYTGEPVSIAEIKRIIQAAYFAPSAAKVQGFQIVVVDSLAQKEKVREICEQGEKEWVMSRPKAIKDTILSLPGFNFKKRFLTDAPVLLIISTDPNNIDIPYAIESCWLATGYMVLEIESLGLGSVTYTPNICLTDQRLELNAVLSLPDEQYIQTVLPVGHYNKVPDRKVEDYAFKVHHNRYGTYLSYNDDDQEVAGAPNLKS